MGLIDDIATGVFQFHNGTINTALLHNNALNIGSFNSTTVQLIQQKHIKVIYAKTFQFHNGTINTVFVTLTISNEAVSIPQRYN